MNFCSNCGATVTLTLPRVTASTGTFVTTVTPSITKIRDHRRHAANLAESSVAMQARHRASLGYWTIPAGFMENGETVEAGAARETAEEANAQVADLSLYTVFSLPHISQVYMFFRANLCDLNFSSGGRKPGCSSL